MTVATAQNYGFFRWGCCPNDMLKPSGNPPVSRKYLCQTMISGLGFFHGQGQAISDGKQT